MKLKSMLYEIEIPAKYCEILTKEQELCSICNIYEYICFGDFKVELLTAFVIIYTLR